MNNTFSHPNKTMSLYPTTKTMFSAPIFACLFYYYYSLPCITKYAIKPVSQSCIIIPPSSHNQVSQNCNQTRGIERFCDLATPCRAGAWIRIWWARPGSSQKIVGTVESCYSLIQVFFL